MTIKIDKGIPLIGVGDKKGRYPFKDMKVGDSFLIPDEDLAGTRNVRATAYAAGIRYKTKYATRTVKGGLRVWRTE